MAKKETIRIRQFKSGIGYSKDQRGTLVGLGFVQLSCWFKRVSESVEFIVNLSSIPVEQSEQLRRKSYRC